MVVIFDTKRGVFTGYRDLSIASKVSKVRADVLRGLEFGQVVAINETIIGKLEEVKSNRGGNNLKK